MNHEIKIFQVPAILDGISPRKDGSMTLRFITNEIKDVEEKSKLMEFYQTFGWMQFSDQSIHQVPREAPAREAGVKTPSQRLRATLYVLWQDRYSDQPFEAWYENQMNKITDRIKKELPPK